MAQLIDGLRRGSQVWVEGFGFVTNHPLHLKPEHLKALRAKGFKLVEAPSIVQGESRDDEVAKAAEQAMVNAANLSAMKAQDDLHDKLATDSGAAS